MDLKPDEQLLVAEFRRLDTAGKKELMDYAVFLGKKACAGEQQPAGPSDRCPLEKRQEERPEADKEPIFTE